MDIYHIYPGTDGSAGLYLDEIYKVLEKEGYIQRAFVHHYYPFAYGDKVYYKHGSLNNRKYSERIRHILMLWDLLGGHIKVLRIARKEKPLLVNYSHAGKSFFFIVWFLRLIKIISDCTLVVTCHDVCPFNETKKEYRNRKRIFDLADRLIVHTEQSVKDLKSLFDINEEKTVCHRFPIMDLNNLGFKVRSDIKTCDFLFIGHLRKSKGICFLLDNWPEFHTINKEATLRVCGRLLSGVSFDQASLEKMNVDFHIGFVNDEEYANYIRAARYVVLPYEKGTNSGIISTVLSLGTNVITSDLPMFKENIIIDENNMFKVNDEKSFISVLDSAYKRGTIDTKEKLFLYREHFSREVLSVYEMLLRN